MLLLPDPKQNAHLGKILMQLIKKTIDQNTNNLRDVDGPLVNGQIIYLTARAM